MMLIEFLFPLQHLTTDEKIINNNYFQSLNMFDTDQIDDKNFSDISNIKNFIEADNSDSDERLSETNNSGMNNQNINQMSDVGNQPTSNKNRNHDEQENVSYNSS